MDSLFDIVSNDYIRTYIALAGFIISTVNSIYLIGTNSFNINLIQKSYAFCEREQCHPAYFEFSIENKSRLPVSISRIYLIVDNNKYEFQWEKQRIGRHEFRTGNEVTEAYSTYSITLPQVIQGCGVVGGFFYVETEESLIEKDFLNSEISVEIHTNKGKKKFKTDLSKMSVHK